MPVYTYEAMNSSGQEVKDEIDATTSDEAIAKIRNKGFFPTKIKEKALKRSAKKKKDDQALSGPTRKMPLSIGGVPRKHVVPFTPPLSTPQGAGLPILPALQNLRTRQKPGPVQAVLARDEP